MKRGATITADKPLEANLACGDPINQYAYDWFTLYPQRAWAGSYYTPVPSMVSGGTLYTTINYFYNANATPITDKIVTYEDIIDIDKHMEANIRCRPIQAPVSPVPVVKRSRC